MTERRRLPSLLIEHATTLDAPDGQPWPPGLMSGWHLVRSVNGRSWWRRITLASPLGAALDIISKMEKPK
jgi:hypothetical protein